MSEETAKVHVDLPNHRATGGETFWAVRTGTDHFRLENVPFFAYDLNFGDVVQARPDATGVLIIERVVTRGGHSTLRVIFKRSVAIDEAVAFLDNLRPLGVSCERDGHCFALDVKPGFSVDAVCDALDEWAEGGRLDFETCHARVLGSFDDEPERLAEEST
ncbi:MAG: DUF4265 domain-containing protein [Vicinamibacteria bacterium]|nr:DUF4265 domain-containing protein [Vicinamibacteria bacterium]